MLQSLSNKPLGHNIYPESWKMRLTLSFSKKAFQLPGRKHSSYSFGLHQQQGLEQEYSKGKQDLLHKQETHLSCTRNRVVFNCLLIYNCSCNSLHAKIQKSFCEGHRNLSHRWLYYRGTELFSLPQSLPCYSLLLPDFFFSFFNTLFISMLYLPLVLLRDHFIVHFCIAVWSKI